MWFCFLFYEILSKHELIICVVGSCLLWSFMLTEAIDYGIAGGFGSYLLGLNRRTYEQAGVDTDGNTPGSYKEPGIGWMTCFLFVTSFVGLLALVPLRKVDLVSIWYFLGQK